MRGADIVRRGALPQVFAGTVEAWLFLLEFGLMLAAALLLFREKIRREPAALYGCALMAIFGFIANRLNVSVTGMEVASGVHYLPKWSEISVTLAIIAFGFAVFRAIARRLPVFSSA
jgi:Ni/Fe-hydrogenase subunit HybB-like protein